MKKLYGTKKTTTKITLKWWQTAFILFCIIAAINGLIQLFRGEIYGLILIMFWVGLFIFLVRKWGKKEEVIDEPQKTDSQIQREKVFHSIYQRQFERLKPIIEANKPISLDQYQENNLRPFIDEAFPNVDVKIVRPVIISTTVAGFQYHDGNKKAVKDMLNDIPIGESLELKRDFENTHSKTATKIYWENYWLGFIPSEYSSIVSDAIDSGYNVSATISNYDNNKTAFFKVEIEVRIDKV